MPAKPDLGLRALPSPTRHLAAIILVAALCALILAVLTGCASDPYPNDRSMARMSVAQLTLELSK